MNSKEIESLDDDELLMEIDRIKTVFERSYAYKLPIDSPETISESIYQISRGVRDCGKFCILKGQDDYIAEFIERESHGIDDFDIRYKIFPMDYSHGHDLNDENDVRDFRIVFLYRYMHQMYLMWFGENVENLDFVKVPEDLHVMAAEYIKGKLLGYSEKAMDVHFRSLYGEKYFKLLEQIPDSYLTLLC